jgi:hypothetical protein
MSRLNCQPHTIIYLKMMMWHSLIQPSSITITSAPDGAFMYSTDKLCLALLLWLADALRYGLQEHLPGALPHCRGSRQSQMGLLFN